jgi:hypothetical protein
MQLKKYLMNFFWDLYIQLFPLGKAHKAHFSTSIWYNESWVPNLPYMYLDHIIAHETYHFFHAYPLNLLSHVSSNNVGHLELKNLSAVLLFWSTNWVYWNLGACNIPLERSWKYLSSNILHAPKLSEITVTKEKL